MKTTIVWLRNDLRVHDHPALAAAAQNSDQVIALFILDDALLNGTYHSSNRNRFLLECLQDVRVSLRTIGSDLVVRSGEPRQVLKQLAQELSATQVNYTIDYTPYARTRDKQVTDELKAAGIVTQAFPGRLAVDSFQGITAANGNIYKVFTPFWKNWATIDRRPLLDVPNLPKLPAGFDTGKIPTLQKLAQSNGLSPDAQTGGESAGRKRLQSFIATGLQHYSETHDTLTPDGTSRLSAYLHFGCLSVREIEDLVEQSPAPGDGPARFHRQLAWRDFYNYVLFHFPDNANQEFQERFRDMPWSYDKDLLKSWQTGQTGYPIIDASMRQLLKEGWMHNRARLIAGSFLTKDLGLDWRLGEQHFARLLIDGDKACNNGNWQWIASVGVDPAPVFRRLYNPTTQQKRYDQDGGYVRYYVPELDKVPDKFLAEPWKLSELEQQAVGCVIGKDYPARVIDHAAARLATLERFRTAPQVDNRIV